MVIEWAKHLSLASAEKKTLEKNNALSWALFSSQKILQNFADFPSHRIFICMHEVLNIDENKN